MENWKKRSVFTMLLGNILLLSSAIASELIIATTLAQGGIQYLIDEWHKQPNSQQITTLNRTSTSLTQLFTTERSNEVDLIISSSPILFHHLQQKQKLAPLPPKINSPRQFVPRTLQNTTVAFSLSGYGMLIQHKLLSQFNIQIPQNWDDLTSPNLQGLLIISSPTRSDTNHIMLETILQRYGWEQGWALLNQIMANVGTISSRSFGVVDKIRAQLGAIGITIDHYANLLTMQRKSTELSFHYFPDFTFSPTFIAVNQHSQNQEAAWQFVNFLLGEQGQSVLNHHKMGKFPITPLPQDSENYAIQQFLFKQPQIDYDLLLKRQALVKLLFEQQITFRLNQLQKNWHLLRQKEKQAEKTLPELRLILNRLPVSSHQANDENYLAHFNSEKTLLDWQKFFISQQVDFIKTLETLE